MGKQPSVKRSAAPYSSKKELSALYLSSIQALKSLKPLIDQRCKLSNSPPATLQHYCCMMSAPTGTSNLKWLAGKEGNTFSWLKRINER